MSDKQLHDQRNEVKARNREQRLATLQQAQREADARRASYARRHSADRRG